MKKRNTFIDVTCPHIKKKSRQIFVAYSYSLYGRNNDNYYRHCFENLEKKFRVKFVSADEQITSQHILQKIVYQIKESDFGIYDITSWNPNVTLELGLALGMNERVFLVLNPNMSEITDVPSDIRGVDRLQYISFDSLEHELERLLMQTVLKDKRWPRVLAIIGISMLIIASLLFNILTLMDGFPQNQLDRNPSYEIFK
jgi:predicted nucleotide-binding protein